MRQMIPVGLNMRRHVTDVVTQIHAVPRCCRYPCLAVGHDRLDSVGRWPIRPYPTVRKMVHPENHNASAVEKSGFIV
jgi:hypothetical protein